MEKTRRISKEDLFHQVFRRNGSPSSEPPRCPRDINYPAFYKAHPLPAGASLSPKNFPALLLKARKKEKIIFSQDNQKQTAIKLKTVKPRHSPKNNREIPRLSRLFQDQAFLNFS